MHLYGFCSSKRLRKEVKENFVSMEKQKQIHTENNRTLVENKEGTWNRINVFIIDCEIIMIVFLQPRRLHTVQYVFITGIILSNTSLKNNTS